MYLLYEELFGVLYNMKRRFFFDLLKWNEIIILERKKISRVSGERIRPNQTDFDRMIEILRKGGGFKESKWGFHELDHDGYGGYYGAGIVQGFASYYYDHVEKGMRSLELNRCNYNSMVDNPLLFLQPADQKNALQNYRRRV